NQLREIDKLQSKARIGFVRAVGFYSFIIGHTLKWSLDLSPGRVAYDFLHQRFRGAHHLFFVYKGHLYINLGKLRLAISSQILIPKALYNLKIAVKSRYHQELFIGLRTLAKCKKETWINADVHQIVSRVFRIVL